jgi:hypothetical protein
MIVRWSKRTEYFIRKVNYSRGKLSAIRDQQTGTARSESGELTAES